MGNDDSGKRAIRLSDEQLIKIVKDTVHETLLTLGVDVDDPLEMQRDFQHIRDLRIATNIIKKRALHVLVGVVVAGIIAAFWIGFKDILLR